MVRAEVPARKIRIACVRFFPGPLGPWVGKICFRCGSRAAPGFAEPTLPVRILAAKARTPEENENRPEPGKAQGESNDPWFHLNLYQRYTLDPRNVGRRRAIACPRSRGPSRRAFVGFAPAIPSLKHPARGTVLCRRFSGLRPIVIYNFSRVKGVYGGFFRPSQFQMDDVQERAVRARRRLAAAPTAYPKVRLIFCRARCPHRAVPGRPGVPPLRNAGIFRFGRRGRRPRRPAGAHCAPLRRPPAILWFLSHRWERNSPRRAKPCEAARPKKEI